MIVSATERRYMPPWHATPAPGFPEFRDSRRLSDADIATIKTWVDAGMPAGDLRRPLTGLAGEALAKGVRIVRELGLAEKYGYRVEPMSAAAA